MRRFNTCKGQQVKQQEFEKGQEQAAGGFGLLEEGFFHVGLLVIVPLVHILRSGIKDRSRCRSPGTWRLWCGGVK